MTNVIESFVADKNKRNYLERAEHRSERQRDSRRTGKIKVMQCPDDTAAQIDRTRQEGRVRRVIGTNDPKAGEKKCDHDGCKYFKESFHPKVDDPPAPILDHGQVRTHSPEESWRIEQSDPRSRAEVKKYQRSVVRVLSQSSDAGASDQE